MRSNNSYLGTRYSVCGAVIHLDFQKKFATRAHEGSLSLSLRQSHKKQVYSGPSTIGTPTVAEIRSNYQIVPIIEISFSRIPVMKWFLVHSIAKIPFRVPIIRRSNYENRNVYKT